MTRASEIEYNAWDSLQNDSLYSWDWDTVFPYLKVRSILRSRVALLILIAAPPTES